MIMGDTFLALAAIATYIAIGCYLGYHVGFRGPVKPITAAQWLALAAIGVLWPLFAGAAMFQAARHR
jgi:hypothetical protein